MTQGNRISDPASLPSFDYPPLDESQCLAKLAAHLPGMLCHFRLFPDGRCMFPYVSEGIRRVYRLNPEDVHSDGTPVFERIHPDDLPRINASIRASAQNLTLWHEQYRLLFRNGSVTWLEGYAQPQPQQDGSILWYAFVTDITRQRQIELAAAQRDSLLQKMADISPVFIWLFDLAGRLEYVNQTLLDFTGQTLNNLRGDGWKNFIHPEDVEHAANPFMARITVHGTSRGTCRIRRADGVFRTLQSWAKPWFDDNQKLLGHIGSGIDITEQQIAQDQVARMRNQLDSILTSLPEVVYSLSPDLQQCFFIGSATHDIYGRPPVAFIEDAKLWIKVIHPNDLYKVETAMEQLHTQGSSCVEYRVLRPDGSHTWVSDKARVIRDSDGTPLRVDGVVADISARIQNEDELRKARDAAEAAGRHKAEFLAGMSHEIRTPMTAIVGYAHLLTCAPASARDQALWNTNLKQNADYLLNLVNDILDLSKIEAGQIELQCQSVDPWSIVQDVASYMARFADEKALTLETSRFGDTPREIHADGQRLRQILVNLASNAVKFSDKGAIGIEMSCEPSPQTGRTQLVFVVSDTGIGIDSEKMAQLFKPFSRLSGAAAAPGAVRSGTGLGLVIARSFAQKMHGDISVESVPGQGSRFTVRIDAGPTENLSFVPDTDNLNSSSAKNNAVTPENALAGLRILVTDDNPDNLRIIQFILEQAGAVVDLASDGKQAVDRILQPGKLPPVDLVLMDMQMPVCDGYTATRILRDHGRNLPVLALTAYTMTGDREKCLDSGCSSYLTKPIVPEILVREILKFVPQSKRAPSRSADAPRKPLNPTLSAMLNNPRFAGLVTQYAQSLRQAHVDILLFTTQSNHHELRVLAHKLKGSGANYGFPEITKSAAACEHAIRNDQSPAQIAATASNLVSHIDSALSLLPCEPAVSQPQ